MRFLSRQAEGNPFFVAEYLRAAVLEGLLWRDGRGRWQVVESQRARAGGREDWDATVADFAALPLPRTLRDLVARRLEGLPPAALRLAQAAAALGREVQTPLLGAMLRVSDEALDEPLNELLRRQVLEALQPELLRFAHDKIRQVATETLTAERRRELHRAAAEAFEARPADEREHRLDALGNHGEQAGDPVRARACYLEGARRAVKRYALEEAERLYRAALRLMEASSLESIVARNELGERVLLPHGRNHEASLEQECAFLDARRLRPRALEADSLRLLANARGAAGHASEGRTLYERALRLCRRLRDRGSRLRVSAAWASCPDQGRMQEARRRLEQSPAPQPPRRAIEKPKASPRTTWPSCTRTRGAWARRGSFSTTRWTSIARWGIAGTRG